MNADQQWPDYEKNPNAEEFRKVFVGGLDAKTTEDTLKEYFSSYGTIENCEIMKERNQAAKSKGFGFITFNNTETIDEIQKNRPHEVDGRKIETKRATPKQQQYWATKKLYIKDFPKEQKEEELIEEMKDVFSAFGTIVNIKLIKDKPADSKDANAVGSLKGFGFIEFDDEDPVDKCNLMRKFKIKDAEAHVSKAYPQDKSMGRGNYYYDYEMYPYEYYQPGPYGGGQRPNFRYQGRGDYQGYGGYDFYPRGNYSRGGGGGGGRPYRGGSGRY
ncbi:heterogeneous nuclear ribonucleoprotein A1-like isoform X2 [Mya arenaria]|uniref:heterogeneous nuclear ribonucleoprotein A1-like isoform X2 n=1 Tax=Mya arenaria TaxID=6604 RepID=UPI0022E7894B|nr:heterogeneous nuclear ribonucleoprotein A1-like isoform X2 [Mya arenaria]